MSQPLCQAARDRLDELEEEHGPAVKWRHHRRLKVAAEIDEIQRQHEGEKIAEEVHDVE